jgi:hypothetical protein
MQKNDKIRRRKDKETAQNKCLSQRPQGPQRQRAAEAAGKRVKAEYRRQKSE